jgi:hypothetical protein
MGRQYAWKREKIEHSADPSVAANARLLAQKYFR